MKKVFNFVLIFTLLIFSFSCASTTNNSSDTNKEEETILKATKQGIEITIPKAAKGKAKTVYIHRYTKDENQNLTDDTLIYSHELSRLKLASITDYFVENGKEYYYTVSFEGGYGSDFEPIKYPLTPITSEGGYGELIPPKNIKGSFDKETCFMTFTPKLEFSKNITNFVKKNPSFKADMYICYTCPYLKEIGEYNKITPSIIDGKANMLKDRNVNTDKLLGHDLNFIRFASEVMDEKKGVVYKVMLTDIDVPKTISIPQSVKK